jgi:hypothetical protein
MFKKILFLSIAGGLTIVATFVQQLSSSDRPYNTSVNIGSTTYDFQLPVVHEGNEESLVEITLPDTSIHGQLFYKKYNIEEKWRTNNLIRMNENLVSVLPHQKPNIKIQYYIELNSKGKTYFIAKQNPVVVRFQGEVPKYILYPQVLVMFISLVIAIFAGMLALFNIDTYKKYAKIAFYLFFLGGFLIGLLVHMISFRHLFIQSLTCNDLTFYKNSIIFLIWLVVYYMNKKYDIRYYTLAGAVLTLVLFCLPQHILFSCLGN